MFSTGIVRRLDHLGRFTLPVELRRKLGISTKDALEIFVDKEFIVLRRYQPADIFNGSMDDLIDYHGHRISRNSILEMARIAGLDLSKKQ